MEKATEPAVRRCYYSRWSGAKESYTRQLQPYILASSGGSGEDLGGSGRYRRRLPAKLSSSPVSPSHDRRFRDTRSPLALGVVKSRAQEHGFGLAVQCTARMSGHF